MKKIISYFLCVLIVFNIFVFNVSATGGSFDDNDKFTHSAIGFTMVDFQNIPDGNHFFYKYADGKAWYCTYADGITNIGNGRLGVSVSPQVLTSLVRAFDSWAVPQTGNMPSVYAVIRNNVNVGYALNDITGCKIVSPTSSSDVTVDSNIVNLIFNFYETQVAVIPPDYIFIPTMKSVAGYSIDSNKMLYNDYFHRITHAAYCEVDNNGTFDFTDSSGLNRYARYSSSPCDYLGVFDTGVFNSIVTNYGLSTSKCNISFAEFKSTQSGSLKVNLFNSSGQSVSLERQRVAYSYDPVDQVVVETFTDLGAVSYFYPYYANYLYFFDTKGGITVYNSISTVSDIHDNVYAPSYRISNTFNDYDSTSTNNTYTTTTNNINNSVTNNETIYNNSNTEINQNMSENNYQYNSSQSSTIINNIINNYYGDSGGSGGGDDNNDDNWWDSLISAIGEFFEGLGRIVAEIIAGIIGIFTDVLNMIADLQVDITALQDFFQQIFGFFPPEIVSLISVSIGLMILICIIKALK